MHQRHRFRPSVEALETRWVPANVSFYSGLLQISNQVGPLRLNQVAANKFTVTDNLVPVGTYSNVGNILINGTNLANVISLHVQGFKYTGSLTVNSGNGDDQVTVRGTGGRIGGNVTILSGLGNDTVRIARDAGALSLGGNLTVADSAGSDTANFGNATGALNIGGSVSLNGMNLVQISSDKANTIGGNFTASVAGDNTTTALGYGLDIEQELPAGTVQLLTIGKSMTLYGNNNDDFVRIGLMTVGGNLTMNLYGAVDSFGNGVNLAASTLGASAITTVAGNLYYTGGAGDDLLDLARGVYNGNVTLNLGTGSNDFVALDDGIIPSQTVIGGDLTVYAEGDFDASPFGDITAAIGGSARFYLGNGDSYISFGPGGTVGGKIVIRAGNGTNFLGLYGAVQYNLDVAFGSGDDEIEINNAAAFVSGYANADGGTNTLDLIDGTLSPTLVLIGF